MAQIKLNATLNFIEISFCANAGDFAEGDSWSLTLYWLGTGSPLTVCRSLLPFKKDMMP